jgi:long-subunit fatty acid transport protein
MKKIIVFLLFISVLMINAQAQNDVDAFRFSLLNQQGTARFMGAGGALGAVGADFSAIGINPATIGIYKSDEITITPIAISMQFSGSNYHGEKSSFLNSKYTLPQAGFVMGWGEDQNKWKVFNFGFGYTRIQDFNNGFHIEGMSQGHSMTSAFINAANGTYFTELNGDAGMAFKTVIIDTVAGNWRQYSSPFENQDVLQKHFVITSGGIDEMSFSFGGNYDNQFFIGGSIGVPLLKYNESVYYEEIDENNISSTLKAFKRSTDLSVKGTGVNLKLGFLYQPVQFLRFGFSFHTPTYFGKMKEYYDVSLNSLFAGEQDYNAKYEVTLNNYYTYKLITPFRLNGNIAFLILKRAFVSVDYEFAHYGMATLFANDEYNFSRENMDIQRKYQDTHTIRVGAEAYITKNFLFRLGYNFRTNPFKEEITQNKATAHLASAGIGFKFGDFFVDAAYSLQLTKENYWMFSYADDSENTYKNNRFVFTFGYKF